MATIKKLKADKQKLLTEYIALADSLEEAEHVEDDHKQSIDAKLEALHKQIASVAVQIERIKRGL